jgi:TatD DNase family protein
LDYYWDKTHIDLQVKAFETQIEWAIERNLPIIIHARESTADCIKSVRKYAGKVTGIFHCFSGNAEEAQQCIDLGFYLGIGGVVTYKKAGMKEMLPAIGIQNIVLETDAPYLTPVPHRGKRNEPSYVKIVAEHVADALQLTDAEVERITTANAHKVFQLG